MRLVIVQYAGDYREAVQRIRASGQETYYAQKYSVDAVANLAFMCETVTVVCCLTAEPYDEVLENGVRAIGAGFSTTIDMGVLTSIVASQNPTHLILRTPLRPLFTWAISHRIRTIAIFADAFSSNGLRNRIRSYRWANLLNQKNVEWVFNHGLNSCLSLKQIGVRQDKIIPWDWPALVTPDLSKTKSLPASGPYALFYVGLIAETKGLGDLLAAVAELTKRSVSVRLQVAGGGEVDRFMRMVQQLNIADRVDFLGLVPHATVLECMKKTDIVVVPSRHEYPEGFPMTIYETLCSRTPLVASDHPMFRANLVDGIDSLTFPAGDSSALAGCIERLLSDDALYSTLSAATAEAWSRLQIPVKFAEAIERWLFDSPENRGWLFSHHLSSGIYPLDRYLPPNQTQRSHGAATAR